MTFTPQKDQRASGSVHPATAAASNLFGSETGKNSNLVSSMMTQQMSFLSIATAFNVEMARQVSNLVLSALDLSLEAAAKNRASTGSTAPVSKSAPSASKLRVVVDNVPSEPKPTKVIGKVAIPAAKVAEAVGTSVHNDSSVDDLKRISGIGPKLETILKSKGINRFSDVARLSAAKASKLDQELGLGGRISRDQWVETAKALAKEQA